MITLLAYDESSRVWAGNLLSGEWGSPKIVTRGRVHQADELPRFVALWDETPVGLITYCMDNGECEIVSLNSLRERCGVGKRLLEAAVNIARAADCVRIWLITTNDNLPALHFYQKRGFTLCAVYPNALEKSRQLKPEIPQIGLDGIPLRDELELERLF